MASIRKQGDVFEIRECIPTGSGPRQRALARFRKILTPSDLDRARAAARQPFDRAALVKRARAQGIPVADMPPLDEARRLLAYLRDGGTVEPILAKLLIESLAGFQVPTALTGVEERSLPAHLEGVLEWVGRPESTRGRALRGLLRAASRVIQSRRALREQADDPFPRFSSGQGFA
jgi:hypothetical protein